MLCACGGASPTEPLRGNAREFASGAPVPDSMRISKHLLSSSPDATGDGTAIDLSLIDEGTIMAAASGQPARLKLTVTCGQQTYPYDLPGDGTPVSVPTNMGDGTYRVAIMLNLEASNYVEILSAEREVSLSSEFSPFLIPNMFCQYGEESACVSEARRIAQESGNQGELAEGICEYVMGRLEYDTDKAMACANATGYVPDPDSSISEGKGICFDYASLCAAMFRSTGIPAKLVTGYVLPDRLYHSWVEAYVDGRWQRYGLSVETGRWSLLDVTMADGSDADSDSQDESAYEVRYVY